MFTVVEDHLKQPVGAFRHVFAYLAWGAVAVADILQIEVGGAAQVAPVLLVDLGSVHTDRVLGFVFVEYGIAPVVVTFTDQPVEDAHWIGRVEDSAVSGFAIDRSDVVFRDGPPVNIAVLFVRPALDAGEQPLDSGAITLDNKGTVLRVERIPLPLAILIDQNWHEILGAGQDKNVRFVCVLIHGQAFIGLAGDRRQRHTPAEAEGSVTGTGIVRERELRAEARAAGCCCDRDIERASARHGISGEFLADTANRAATFG